MSLGLHYIEGKLHLHPSHTAPALDCHFQLRAHFHPITTHQRFAFPSLWLRETRAIKSLQCSLSATCNLKPISDLTHHEHEEISPQMSKCQFLSESNIANESVIAIIFSYTHWVTMDSLHYDLRSWELLWRWEFCWLLVKSLTKGLFNPIEGDRKLKSQTGDHICSKLIGAFPFCLECCKLGATWTIIKTPKTVNEAC